SSSVYGEAVHVMNAAGPVTLDGRHQDLEASALQPALVITDSPQVHVRSWTLRGTSSAPACTITNSSVVFEECLLLGADADYKAFGLGSQIALSANHSSIQFVHTSLHGGQGATAWYMGMPSIKPGSSALVMIAGSVRAMGQAGH